MAKSPQSARDDVNSQVRLGAEFFLNRTETKESVQKHFRIMREHGFTIARIFIIWHDIEPKRDEWHFERYDWVYDAAATNGIKIAATLCAEDPPGWMKLTVFYHLRADMNNPEYRQRAAVYLEKVVGHYKDHPAQGTWLLMNEPDIRRNEYGRPTMEAFAKWLQARYGNVETLNKRWFPQLSSFSEVQISPDQWTIEGWADYFSFVDWNEFRIDNLCEHLRWISNRVRELDQKHSTHINPWHDAWREAATVDSVGASIHAAWRFNEFSRKDFGLAFAYAIDQLSGAAAGRPWWVTELQSGPTVFTGGRSMSPTPGEITRWLWDAYGAGARSVIFWLWHPRTENNEAGEWNMVSLAGHPSVRARAAKAVAETLQRLPTLAQATAQPAGVAILWNRQAQLLAQIDGRQQASAKRAREPEWSVIGCYRALHDAHIPVVFVDVAQLKAGVLSSYKVLYLPYAYAIDEDALRAVRSFVQAGGTVWADGLLGWKTEYGEIRDPLPGGLADVFGWESYDVQPVTEPYSLTSEKEQGGERWKIPLELKGAEVLLRDAGGQPFATSHRFGKGRAIYYGSALALSYYLHGSSAVQKWIASPAMEHAADLAVQMTDGSGDVTLRGLEYPGGLIAVLVNWGDASDVRLRFRRAHGRAIEVMSGAELELAQDGQAMRVKLTVPAGAVRVVDLSM
jgi:beta-galactosidase